MKTDHGALVDQHDSAEAEASRILKTLAARTWPSCRDLCRSGRGICPCPDACQRPEWPITPMFRWFGVALAIVVVAIVLVIVFGGRQ